MEPRYNIDLMARTAVMDIVIGGEVVTSYVYVAGEVTMSERPDDTTVGLDEMRRHVASISRWAGLVQSLLGVAPSGRDDYDERHMRTGDDWHSKFKSGHRQITDVSGTATDASFKARPQAVLGWGDFVAWVQFLERLAREAVPA